MSNGYIYTTTYAEPNPLTSLRDRFALAALPWCLSEFGGNAPDQTQYADAAYEVADAMLAARNRKPTDAKGEGRDDAD